MLKRGLPLYNLTNTRNLLQRHTYRKTDSQRKQDSKDVSQIARGHIMVYDSSCDVSQHIFTKHDGKCCPTEHTDYLRYSLRQRAREDFFNTKEYGYARN